MSALRESRGSDVFRFECDECGRTGRVRTGTSHDAILWAARKGWTFAGRRDICPSCRGATRPGRGRTSVR